MPVLGEDILKDTFEAIQPGDSLQLVGGIFPGQGETELVIVRFGQVVPILHLALTGMDSAQDNPPYPNPLGADIPDTEVELERIPGRIVHEAAEAWFGMGKRLGRIGLVAATITVLGFGSKSDYYLTKPE